MRSVERLRNSLDCLETLWTAHGGTAAFAATQHLCSDKQRAPCEAPRWGLSTWPERTGQTTAQTTQGTDSNT